MAVNKLEEKKVKELVDACLKAKENAYARYSNFRVGAAILTSEGKIFTGNLYIAMSDNRRPISKS